jgi:hypothetical protein
MVRLPRAIRISRVIVRQRLALRTVYDTVKIVSSRSAFALPGDSGSLVVTEDGTAAVGVLFASSTKGDYGQMIPISHALKILKVTLVSGHGL